MIKYKPGIRDKLIGIFVLIKVIPLIVLAWFAWNEISTLVVSLESHVNEMAKTSVKTTSQVVGLATYSSIRALDVRSREAIESLTITTAQQVADFLKDRDMDILTATLLAPDRQVYADFLKAKTREVVYHEPWRFIADKNDWGPVSQKKKTPASVQARNSENELDFHYRSPKVPGVVKNLPLYLEMTFVDLSGKEQIKVTTSDLMSPQLKDISQKEQTFCRAETYFEQLKNLSPGQIYVSDVIGAYVPAHMVGKYTPERAAKMSRSFLPEESGYAGKENPVGRRFQGIIRWAVPVVRNDKIKGYVTLAIDHTHVMEFTDHIVPTEERFSSLSDAASGNYAFMWDHQGRNISHPRDYFIVGYDPKTGLPAIPWLEEAYYEKYRLSELGIDQFLSTMPTFENQTRSKKSSKELTQKGFVALDCRYLNFAPQCDGWYNLTQFGGSGSFVIQWSGLKKLTTAATIPYYTGQYGQSSRGFGFVTIGANVDEFHKPAMVTAKKISETEKTFIKTLQKQTEENKLLITSSMNKSAIHLVFYTIIMVICVIAIAVFMASTLTGKIIAMIKGLSRFQNGEMDYRLTIGSSDEIGVLSQAFNTMADSVQNAILNLEQSNLNVEDSNVSLKTMLSEIINSMPSMIIGVDTQGKITLWNHEASKVTQKKFELVEGKDLFEIFPLLVRVKSLIFNTIGKNMIQKGEHLQTFVDEERLFYDVTVYPLTSKQTSTQKNNGAVLRIDNVTHRVYMEEMMIQTEKMQSIGGLAAGMAHEINSPLAGIIQSAQVIQKRTGTDLDQNMQVAQEIGLDLNLLGQYFEKRKINSMVSAIIDAGRRAADIVANMLTFSRKSESVFTPQKIEKILDQTVDILQKDYDLKKDLDFKKIKIIRNYDPELKTVLCDFGKIQQVFFNILKNGAHAMTGPFHVDGPLFELTVTQDGTYTDISISDNGFGMSEEVKTRIFEPFFTTKAVGVGTGLGLYVSYFIIVENHKGTITVDSLPDHGTKFVIRLPLNPSDKKRNGTPAVKPNEMPYR